MEKVGSRALGRDEAALSFVVNLAMAFGNNTVICCLAVDKLVGIPTGL